MEKWQNKHEQIISLFLKDINKNQNTFILKGGTALRQCYKLDRFSEDIDLDVKNKTNLIETVNSFCQKHNFIYRIAKDTETVKRCFINYGNEHKPLKIEASYRNKTIDNEDITIVNNIQVYNINRIAQMKANAYATRDKIRDLYDLTFICNHYFESLSKQTINIIGDAVGNKGLEQFDYLLATQKDPLINSDKLAYDFLEMNEKLGLLYSKEEKENFSKQAKKVINIKPIKNSQTKNNNLTYKNNER